MSERAAVWDAVHAERLRLVADLAGLTEQEWQTPSLCAGWSVHDVVAHLVESATTTRAGFLGQMVAARFDFDRANERGVRRFRADDPRTTLAALEAVAGRTDSPPGPLATRLVEAYVHGEDIRRPLGRVVGYPSRHVMTGLVYLARTGAGLGGGRERVQGLSLHPCDVDQQIGSGPAVHGTALALLLAVSGRPCAPGELTGPGAPVLSART